MWAIIFGEHLIGPFKTADTAAKYAVRKLTGVWQLQKLIGPTP